VHPRAAATPAPHSDAELVRRTSAGDNDALALLYERHGGRLLTVAYRLLGSRADAEDVVHDVFVGLPEALRRYDERGSLGAWLRVITARMALARMRREQLRGEVDSGADIAAPPRDALAAVTLENALRALTPSLRAVVVLREIEGFTHKEIASMLGISRGASEVRLHRAIAELRRILGAGERR